MNYLKTLAVAAIAATGVTLSSASVRAMEEIVIGYVDDLSSLVAEAGNDSLNGVRIAVEEANRAGGINGRQIRLVTYDGKVDPQLTSTFVTRVIVDDEAIVVLGGNVSGAVPATIQIVTEEMVPFFSMSAAADEFTDPPKPYFFRFGPSNSQDAVAVADLIADSGFETVGIINNSLPFGLDGANAITAALGAHGIEVIINETYEVNATDLSPQVAKLRDADPDAIVVWPYPADGGRVIRTMAQLDVDKPTVIARVALFDTFRELAGEAADGVMVPNTVDTSRADVRAMLDVFAERFGQRPPTMYIAMGYDGANAAITALGEASVQAAIEAGDLHAARQALLAAMETIGSFESIQGAPGNRLQFGPGQRQGLQGDSIFVWAEVQDGGLITADLEAFAN